MRLRRLISSIEVAAATTARFTAPASPGKADLLCFAANFANMSFG